MADRIQNFQNIPVSGAGTAGELKPSDLEILRPKIENALPAAIAPQPGAEQLRSVGVTKNPEATRLQMQGTWGSNTLVQTHIRKAMARVKLKAIETQIHPNFFEKEKQLGEVLGRVGNFLAQVGSGLANTQRA